MSCADVSSSHRSLILATVLLLLGPADSFVVEYRSSMGVICSENTLHDHVLAYLAHMHPVPAPHPMQWQCMQQLAAHRVINSYISAATTLTAKATTQLTVSHTVPLVSLIT
ncbi:hypothetical protein [Oryza sativa Japonica Group]|uniref:Uncharacterized protein n=1 Tax=Oryza sativa subsp. japonica TaxID=39947 RepID=Q655R0_ORYSJ|nr:hypothetical protein [Oryza sativa Japonica Group]